MKLKECIALAVSMLDVNEEESAGLLVICANNCLDEITSEYLPLKCEALAQANDGKILYSDLGEVYDIVSVTKNGKKVDYELMPSYIKVNKDDVYSVKFCCRPPTLTPEDDVPNINRLTARILAYGIAAEYLLIKGFYDEAVTYDQRFKDALKRAAYGSGEKRIKLRRWLI